MDERVNRLSARELAEMARRGESFVLLDVREDRERHWAKIAVPEPAVALHVPMGSIPEQLDAIRAQILDRPLVVYCHHGVRSLMVAEWLMEQRVGASVSNLEGGIEEWSLAIDPAVKRY